MNKSKNKPIIPTPTELIILKQSYWSQWNYSGINDLATAEPFRNLTYKKAFLKYFYLHFKKMKIKLNVYYTKQMWLSAWNLHSLMLRQNN